MNASRLSVEQHQQAVDLAAQLIDVLPDGMPADVAAVAAVVLVRYVASQDASMALRIGAVLSHVAHELASGQLFNNLPH